MTIRSIIRQPMLVNSLNILITRPEPDNTLSCDRATQEGFHAIALPMLDIVPISDKNQVAAIRAKLFNIDEFHYVIFVSKNAARAAAEWNWHCWPMLPIGVCWIGIGKGTTDELIKEGIPAIANPGYTSEALLDWLKPIKMQHMKILIVRGQSGRPELGNQLKQRGAKVSYLSLYERRKPTYHARTFAMLPDIDLIWATSSESLINLNSYVEHYKPSYKSILLLTPSVRVNELAKKMDWKNVVCAQGADDISLIKATQLHIGKKNDRDE